MTQLDMSDCNPLNRCGHTVTVHLTNGRSVAWSRTTFPQCDQYSSRIWKFELFCDCKWLHATRTHYTCSHPLRISLRENCNMSLISANKIRIFPKDSRPPFIAYFATEKSYDNASLCVICLLCMTRHANVFVCEHAQTAAPHRHTHAHAPRYVIAMSKARLVFRDGIPSTWRRAEGNSTIRFRFFSKGGATMPHRTAPIARK